MKDRITPVGLKGNEINERMKQLMGIQPINENKKSSAVELTKMGPDGNAYAIIRENHEYYIKISKKTSNLKLEDFSYIGGLQNKKQEAYPTYAKAIKQLNLKFNSLNEAYGKSGQINVFKDDNLLGEAMGMGFTGEGNLEGNQMSECCGAPMMEGMCMECGGSGYGMEEYDKQAMASFQNQYGDENGESIYYATANTQDRNPETFKKNEDMGMMDELSDKQKQIAALAGDPNEFDAADLAALRAGKHIENEGIGDSKMEKLMSMIAGVESKMDNGKKPKVWVDNENENCLNLSAEDGQYFADYYGEMDGSGYPYIDPRLEAIADEFDSYWEWVNPGVVTLCLDSLDETQQAVHDMMEDDIMNEGILLTLGGLALGAGIIKKAYNYITNRQLESRMQETGQVKKGSNGVVMKEYSDSQTGETFWGVDVTDKTRDQGFQNRNILLFKNNPERIDKILSSEIVNNFSDEDRMSNDFEKKFGQFKADKMIRKGMSEDDEMTDKQKEFAKLAPPYDKITYADKIAGATKNEGKLSIEKAINEMDEIIDSVLKSKKKVYTLK